MVVRLSFQDIKVSAIKDLKDIFCSFSFVTLASYFQKLVKLKVEDLSGIQKEVYLL